MSPNEGRHSRLITGLLLALAASIAINIVFGGRLSTSLATIDGDRERIIELTGQVKELGDEQQRAGKLESAIVRLNEKTGGLISDAQKQTGNTLEKLRQLTNIVRTVQEGLRDIASGKLDIGGNSSSGAPDNSTKKIGG